MATQRPQGDLIQADFFENSAGLNITDSPFRVQDGQATSGYNYDYFATGGIQKSYGHGLVSTTPSSLKRTLGYALHTTSLNVKTLVRAADSNLESMSLTAGVGTVLTSDDATPVSDYFSGTQPVVFSQFNTTTVNTLWAAGGNLASGQLLGYNGTKLTLNGSSSPTGSISGTPSGADGSLPAGTYYYAVALRKASTQAISNAALDVSVTVGATNHVTISLSSLTSLDTTKYDRIYIYRSAISGVSGFTIGDLAGTVASNATSFTDTGAVQGTAQAVPRSGSASLDNSVLPAGNYKTITTWKRRLVTAQASTVYISDLNKPESWPAANPITIPSGGDIRALGIISFSTPTTTSNDEFLVIFKERECWVITGSAVGDFALKFIDYVGCVSQSLLVLANGFLGWIDYRGVYLWDGSYKPIYVSRPIEADFKPTGDIDLSNLTLGWGTFYKKQNEIIWVISSSMWGVQKLALKLDVRLTYPQISEALAGRIMEGVFIKDKLSSPLYAGFAALPNSQEALYAGDDLGNTYSLYSNINANITNSPTYWDQATFDSSVWDYQYAIESAIPFKYRTKTLDFGSIGTTKRFHKIIAWCKDSSTANLSVNYWLGYKLDTDKMATQSQPIALFTTNAYWDQSYWDQAQWDLALANYNPVVFNLTNSTIGVEGNALTLEFSQNDLNSPVIIAGFSVIYSLSGLRM
jgi:hypothetical protein